MSEFRSRVVVAFLISLVIGIALLNMVVDRRALGQGGRDLPWWSAAVLDVAVPVQKMVAVPLGFARDSWLDYVALVQVREENEELQLALARQSETKARASRPASPRVAASCAA